MDTNQTIKRDVTFMKMPKNLHLAAPSVSKLIANNSKQQQIGSSISKSSIKQQITELANFAMPNFSKMPKTLSLNPQSSASKSVFNK